MGMRVLIVAREKDNRFAPFVTEQVEALKEKGIECLFFPMKGAGIIGYLRQLPAFRKSIQSFNPDIIHAHYGLCGLFANLQRRVPVVTTYHGSDINNTHILKISRLSVRLSAHNIFVSQKNTDIVKPREKYSLIPCGINLDDYPIVEKDQARKQLGLSCTKKYILFAGAFDNPVKNAPLAKAAAVQISEAELLELKGYNRRQVAILLQAVDALIMTSKAEGSPQIIKEALACGTPVVSVDVGDVRERLEGLPGCWVVGNNNEEELVKALNKALMFKGRSVGRQKIQSDHLENKMIANRLIGIYNSVITRQ